VQTSTLLVQHYPRLPRKREGVRLVIPACYSGYIRVLLGIWLGAWGIVEAALLWNVFGERREPDPNPAASSPAILTTLLAIFTMAGGFIVWRLVWVSYGREILDITRKQLTLSRRPGFAGPVEFDRSMIRDVRVGSYRQDLVYPSWGRRFVGKESAFVSFRYRNKTYRIGRGLSVRDANYVLDLMHSTE
jgi:hypothetical protein